MSFTFFFQIHKRNILWAKRCRNRDLENCFELLVGTKAHEWQFHWKSDWSDSGWCSFVGVFPNSDLLPSVVVASNNIKYPYWGSVSFPRWVFRQCHTDAVFKEERTLFPSNWRSYCRLPPGQALLSALSIEVPLMSSVSWIKSLMLRGFSCENQKALP